MEYPELAAEWDYEANYPLRPDQVTVSSGKKVMWKCELGHSYSAKVFYRTGNDGTGCPYCAGQKVLEGFNDLETLYPELAEEWDYEANYPLRPNQVTVGSGKEVTWKCELGHSYSAKVFCRTGDGSNGCPYCSGRVPIKGETDLATRYPEVCQDWDYSKNKKNPEDYTAFSKSLVHWKCHKCGNKTNQRIDKKVKGIGCRKCKSTNI